MFKIFKKTNKVEKSTKNQLKENKAVIESLRDYDAGKKEISTDKVKRRMLHI
jgi:hypothetical protein